MAKKEEEKSYLEILKEIYHKCKESVNFYIIALANIFNLASSGLEAISLGLIVPLFEKVLSQQPGTDLGIVQKALDYLHVTDTKTVIITVALMILTAVILKNFFTYLSGWVSRIMNSNIDHTLRVKVMNNYLKRDLLFFEKRRMGGLTYTLELTSLFSAAIEKTNNMVKDFFFCLGYAAMMAYIAPQISFFIVIVFLPLYLISRWVSKIVQRIARQAVETNKKFSIKKMEILSAVKLIKMYSSEKSESDRYTDLSKRSKELAIKRGNRSSLIGVLEEPIMTLGVMLLAGISFFYFIDTTKGGIAGFMTFFVILRRFEWQFQSFLSQFALYTTDKPQLEQLTEAFKTEKWMTIPSGKRKFKKLKNSVEFKNVYFSYENNGIYALKDINLKIQKGRITALVGESGSGKTTLAMLIPRLYEYHKGKILLDGTEIKKYDSESLRRNIGIVSQDVEILSRTVRENITFGLKKEVSDETIIKICKKAQIWKFIESLPNKLDTVIGERGMDLSGGQKQRISIARALLKNPEILILDEATSALDTETEQEIQKSIEETIKGKTVLAIAHRLSTIENADRIAVIEEGNIKEQGGFKELLKKKGKFYNYWKIQTEIKK